MPYLKEMLLFGADLSCDYRQLLAYLQFGADITTGLLPDQQPLLFTPVGKTVAVKSLGDAQRVTGLEGYIEDMEKPCLELVVGDIIATTLLLLFNKDTIPLETFLEWKVARKDHKYECYQDAVKKMLASTEAAKGQTAAAIFRDEIVKLDGKQSAAKLDYLPVWSYWFNVDPFSCNGPIISLRKTKLLKFLKSFCFHLESGGDYRSFVMVDDAADLQRDKDLKVALIKRGITDFLNYSGRYTNGWRAVPNLPEGARVTIKDIINLEVILNRKDDANLEETLIAALKEIFRLWCLSFPTGTQAIFKLDGIQGQLVSAPRTTLFKL